MTSVSLVGHPYTPIGMGEHVRCTFRSLRSVARAPRLLDVYKLTAPDEADGAEFTPHDAPGLSDINVFHINGDEVEAVLAHLDVQDGYNVVYPLWELARYPRRWARQLERFDEIWAPSRFVQASIAAATDRTVLHMPLACEVMFRSFLGRRYFAIPEAAYTFLFFFDLRSYVSRKNPQAVIEAFREATRLRPDANISLVIKVNGAELAPERLQELEALLADLADRTVLIKHNMSDNEIKNLVRCCDCFVSLHRSEGFGFGIAQAMSLDKPVIATAYSGNMDFMEADCCFPVPFALVPVPEGAYPHWEDQVWAQPSMPDAVRAMVTLIDSPTTGYEVGRRAGRHIRSRFSLRATGRRVAERLEQIAAKGRSGNSGSRTVGPPRPAGDMDPR